MIDLATRYSEACTRSAIATLVASAACFTFAQRLAVIEPLQAFGNYVLGRENLNIALGEILGSEYWTHQLKMLEITNTDEGTVTLRQLESLECVSSSNENYVRRKSNDGGTEKVSVIRSMAPIGTANAQLEGKTQPAVPKPPVLGALPGSDGSVEASVVIECPGLDEVSVALADLTDDENLDIGRRVSNTHSVEVYRWQVTRNRVFARTIYAPAHRLEGYDVGSKTRFHALTIADLRELDKTPYTSMKEFDAVLALKMVVVTPYSLGQQGLSSASLVFEIITLILVTYFLINLRAAIEFKVLFGRGSLFATLCSSTIGIVYSVLLILLPGVATSYLAFRMQDPERLIGAVAAVATTILTLAVLYLAARTMWFERKGATER